MGHVVPTENQPWLGDVVLRESLDAGPTLTFWRDGVVGYRVREWPLAQVEADQPNLRTRGLWKARGVVERLINVHLLALCYAQHVTLGALHPLERSERSLVVDEMRGVDSWVGPIYEDMFNPPGFLHPMVSWEGAFGTTSLDALLMSAAVLDRVLADDHPAWMLDVVSLAHTAVFAHQRSDHALAVAAAHTAIEALVREGCSRLGYRRGRGRFKQVLRVMKEHVGEDLHKKLSLVVSRRDRWLHHLQRPSLKDATVGLESMFELLAQRGVSLGAHYGPITYGVYPSAHGVALPPEALNRT